MDNLNLNKLTIQLPISFPTLMVNFCRCTTNADGNIELASSGPDGTLTKYEFSMVEKINNSLFGGVYRGKILCLREDEAHQFKVNDLIAVKTISKQKYRISQNIGNTEDPLVEIRCLKYIQTLGGHKNIVKSIDFLEDDNFYYSVMELIDGRDIFDIIDRAGKPFDNTHAKMITGQIVDALSFLNANGICHRDISSENVMITTKDCEVKIIIN